MPERMTSQNQPTSAKDVPVPNADQHAVSIKRAAAAAEAAEAERLKRQAEADQKQTAADEALQRQAEEEARRMISQAAAAKLAGVPQLDLPPQLRSPDPVPEQKVFATVAEGFGISILGAHLRDLSGLLLVARVGDRGPMDSCFMAIPASGKLGAEPARVDKVLEEDRLTFYAAQLPLLGVVVLVTVSGDSVSCTWAPRPV